MSGRIQQRAATRNSRPSTKKPRGGRGPVRVAALAAALGADLYREQACEGTGRTRTAKRDPAKVKAKARARKARRAAKRARRRNRR